MDDILPFLRTSLAKNPEEWSFEDSFRSSGRVFSTMNLYFHAPTEYVLILMHVPMASESDQEPDDLYYVQLMEYEEYLEAIEENDGNFAPDPEYVQAVHRNSVIVKTLNFIKTISIADEKILKYSKFKNYVKEKMDVEESIERIENG
jgi:hypothetical protein